MQRKNNIGIIIKLLFKIRDHKDGNGERLYFYKLYLRLYEKIPSIVTSTLGLLTGGYDSNMELDNEKPFGGFVDLNKLRIYVRKT